MWQVIILGDMIKATVYPNPQYNEVFVMRACCMSYPEKSSITCIDKLTVPCTEKMGILHIEKSAIFLIENATKSLVEKLAVPIAQN
jgi:hypothetical protein